MKIQELRNLSQEELVQKAKVIKQELFKLSQERYAARVDKPHKFSLLRREMARIETLLNLAKKEK